MHILITGGTGFIGTPLCHTLIGQGHLLTVLSRFPQASQQAVRFIQNLAELSDLNDVDAVINLAGEAIFDRFWTIEQKNTLRQSRLDITRQLVQLIQHSKTPPHTFLSASATGLYGNLPDFAKNYDEQTACSNDFAARLCLEWETAALDAESSKTRVCLLRTGMILGANGGALQRMLPFYRLGLGGKIGHGKQHWSWISLHDHLRAILFLLEQPHARGAFNLVAPQSTTNAIFNQQLAKLLYRPAFCQTPAWLLKLILGERSQLLLDNQPLVPARLLSLGFEFHDETLENALRKALT